MKYIKVTITLPEDVADRLSKVNNKSGELADALRFYSEWKDKAKAMMANSDKILRFLTEQKMPDMVLGPGTGTFQDTELVQAKRDHLDWRIERQNGELVVWHRGKHFWQPLSDAEMDVY